MQEIAEKQNKAVELYDNENFEEAYVAFFSLAEKGDVDSQKTIANMLIHGTGTAKDEKSGYEWYLRAAELGDAEAQYWTAFNDFENNNTEKGLKFLNLSMDSGYADAAYWLGRVYLYGFYSVKIDAPKAQEFFKIAIRKRVNGAQRMLFEAKVKEVGRIRALIYCFTNRKVFISDVGVPKI